MYFMTKMDNKAQKQKKEVGKNTESKFAEF